LDRFLQSEPYFQVPSAPSWQDTPVASDYELVEAVVSPLIGSVPAPVMMEEPQVSHTMSDVIQDEEYTPPADDDGSPKEHTVNLTSYPEVEQRDDYPVTDRRFPMRPPSMLARLLKQHRQQPDTNMASFAQNLWI
jgi:hypothetical protein